MNKRDQDSNNQSTYLHKTKFKASQASKTYENMKTDSYKACNLIFKRGSNYCRLQVVDASLMQKMVTEAIRKYNREKSKKKNILLNPKSRSPKSTSPRPKITVTYLVFNVMYNQSIGSPSKILSGTKLQVICPMVHHSWI